MYQETAMLDRSEKNSITYGRQPARDLNPHVIYALSLPLDEKAACIDVVEGIFIDLLNCQAPPRRGEEFAP